MGGPTRSQWSIGPSEAVEVDCQTDTLLIKVRDAQAKMRHAVYREERWCCRCGENV